MFRILLFIVTSILFCNSIYAQDIHYSQYRQAPLLLNPALTGDSDGDWRAGINYREQWTATSIPFNTVNLFYDKKVFVHSKVFMAGGYLLFDQLNTNGLTRISFTPSFACKVNYEKNILSFGLQPGIGLYSINEVLTHPDQFNYETGTFDNELPTNDFTDDYSKLFPDINLGVSWSRPVYGLFPRLNLAMYHINKPKNSIYSGENNERMPIKTLINFDLPLPVSNQIRLTPSVLLIRQGKSQEVNMGAECNYSLLNTAGKFENIFVGAYYRDARSKGFNALVISGGIKYSGFTFTLSYDEYFNTYNYASSLGKSFEVSVIFTGINSITDKFSIPCDIY